MHGSERDGCGGAAADRLGEDVFAGGCWQVLANGCGLFRVGDGPDAFSRNKWFEARDGLLQHGVRADDIEQLLGRAGAAARPEASSAASGEDYSVCGEFFCGHESGQVNNTCSIAEFGTPLRESLLRSFADGGHVRAQNGCWAFGNAQKIRRGSRE